MQHAHIRHVPASIGAIGFTVTGFVLLLLARDLFGIPEFVKLAFERTLHRLFRINRALKSSPGAFGSNRRTARASPIQRRCASAAACSPVPLMSLSAAMRMRRAVAGSANVDLRLSA